jgi:hypothetical protein
MSSSSKTATSAAACPPGTLLGGPIRTRFFDGMFLTQSDLETEQRYWRIKRRLTNRALGEGVVWGLRLEWKKERHAFVLSPGYALDCCGNDLVVECPEEISEQQLWSRADPSLRATKLTKKKADDAFLAGNNTYSHYEENLAAAAQRDVMHACVVLQYVECPEEARPVHRDACAGPTGYCEASRIRESARLLLVPPPTEPLKTPPEKFLEELYKFRDSLDPTIRDLLFPPQGTPPVTTPSGLTPMSLIATVPGSSPSSVTIQIPGTGTASAPNSLQATQTVTAGRRTGVVTFQLRPSAGWAFTDGDVSDQGRIVESVTPPAAPSMFWSLDIALPDNDGSATIDFDFLIDDVEVSETFGGSSHGKVTAHVLGTATANVVGTTATVTVDKLRVTTTDASVFEDTDGQACLRELVPWGWTVDPANGSKIARTLVLASLYAFLSEVTRRGSSTAWRTIAMIVYTLGWYLLFGVNPAADVPEKDRQKLAQLILDLYKRWCEGFVYPGPRCSDEHHGVYLGCVELSRSGAIRSFDMWQHRRHVVTGPLLAHWGQQLGIAPIDVIAGRFAQAMCCLSGLPPITLPPFGDKLNIDVKSGPFFHVGTYDSVNTYGKSYGSPVSWMSPASLSLRMTEAFTMRGLEGRPVEVLASKLPDGGSIAIAVPKAETKLVSPKIRSEVTYNLRHTPVYVRESGREAVADFTIDLMKSASPSMLLNKPDTHETHEIAEALDKQGATSADIAEDGSAAMLFRSGLPDNKANREGAANLVEHAEKAVDNTVKLVVKLMGPKLDRASFGDDKHQKLLAEGMKDVIPKLSPETVMKIADRTAKG